MLVLYLRERLHLRERATIIITSDIISKCERDRSHLVSEMKTPADNIYKRETIYRQFI